MMLVIDEDDNISGDDNNILGLVLSSLGGVWGTDANGLHVRVAVR